MQRRRGGRERRWSRGRRRGCIRSPAGRSASAARRPRRLLPALAAGRRSAWRMAVLFGAHLRALAPTRRRFGRGGSSPLVFLHSVGEALCRAKRMIRYVGRCLGLAVWTASSERRMCLVPVHEGQRRVGRSRLLTAPPLSPAGGRRVQSSVCGRRAQVLAGRTRRPGVAVAEGSGSSERRRRRVVAAVAARATCIDGLLTGGNEACPSAIHPYLIEIELCGHLWWGRPLSSAKSRRARELM